MITPRLDAGVVTRLTMNSLIFLLKDSQKFHNLVKIWHIIHVRKIYTGGERMAKRKSKYDDFITMCEKNKKLYTLATTSTPSCSLYDVIDRNFVIAEKSVSHKKSSSRRIAKPDTVFIASRPVSRKSAVVPDGQL